MIALDVNILVAAFRDDAVDHALLGPWLREAVNGPDTVGVSAAVIVGSARILTHPRIFSPPSRVDNTWGLLRDFLAHENVVLLTPGPRHLALVERLCRVANATGNLVSDAAHAAIAIEHGATFVTKDRDFARFPGLRWRHPLSG